METFKVKAENVELYCEKYGAGPLVVLVPDGSNDCGHFANVAQTLSDEFTVVTFDMRGGTRSMPTVNVHVTPKLLADDIAAVIRHMNMGKAAVYGCSSGGQAALALGKYYSELVRNLIVHEAALQSDTQLPNVGFSFFKTIAENFTHLCNGFAPMELSLICNWNNWIAFGDEFLKRVNENWSYWTVWYLGTVDCDSYTKEELKKMPNLEFSVGAWTPSWLTYANISTAEKGGKPLRWLPSSHYPHVSCPEEFVAFVRETCKKYL